MDFVQLFLKFTEEYESPTSFWRWSAYAAVAATLRDNIYFDHGMRRTYPNIYVILLADSAEHRKGGPFIPVTKVARELKNIRIIQGRNSIQGILDDLSQNVGPIQGGSCFLCAEELASFFVADPALIPLLTDIYDYREHWEYKLKQTTTKVKNLCVTMLAASNAEFLKEVYTNAAVYGGLLGRTIMVKPDESRPANDLLEVDIAKYDFKILVDSLNKIKLLKGPVQINKDARELYRKWYSALYKSYKTVRDRTGVTQRMHTTVLKVAMVIAASKYSIEIKLDDMQEAIDQITALKSNYEVYAMSSGKSVIAEIGALLLNSLWEAKDYTMARKEILRIHWNMMSAEDLDKVVETFLQAGLIEANMMNGGSGSAMQYTMTEKCKKVFRKES